MRLVINELNEKTINVVYYPLRDRTYNKEVVSINVFNIIWDEISVKVMEEVRHDMYAMIVNEIYNDSGK